METTPAALPVPPLTEEQKAATPVGRFLWQECLPEEYKAILAAYDPLKQAHKPAMEIAYAAILNRLKAENAALRADQMKQFEGSLSMKQFITSQGDELNASKSEVTRLSLLLEEERRTVALLREQAILWVPISQGYPDQFEVCLLAGNLGPDMLHGVNTLKRTYRHNPELRVWELHGRAERQVPESAVHYYALLPESPSEPEAAAPCQRDCQKCEKAEPWQGVFATEADYDASVADVCRRITSGEITPREVGLAQLHRCDLCDDSPCGLCPEHASRFGGGAGVGLQGEEGGGNV